MKRKKFSGKRDVTFCFPVGKYLFRFRYERLGECSISYNSDPLVVVSNSFGLPYGAYSELCSLLMFETAQFMERFYSSNGLAVEDVYDLASERLRNMFINGSYCSADRFIKLALAERNSV